MVRTYSNATAGKDVVLAGGTVVLYRLKDEKTRSQFNVNLHRRKAVRVFRKVEKGVMELGLFLVEAFVRAEDYQQPAKFGPEFVRFVKAK